jgi:hypothetical protein
MLYNYSALKKYKNDYARKQSQENEINNKECTFKPQITSITKNEEDLITRTYQ